MLDRITSGGYALIRIVTTFFAVIFMIYSLLTLWDMYRTEIRAFVTFDLMQYKPDLSDDGPYLDELIAINPDTAAWLTVYGTNIDYPVMHGEDDHVYLNTTPTGEYSLSGSIYMSSVNAQDFSDAYTMLHGHHLMNGSMFGDLEKFVKSRDFLYNTDNCRYTYDEGILIQPDGTVWDLHAFAALETSAYDDNIYNILGNSEDLTGVINYVRENAELYSAYEEALESEGTDAGKGLLEKLKEASGGGTGASGDDEGSAEEEKEKVSVFRYRDVGEIDKVLGMSTCETAVTDIRTVVLWSMTLRTDPLPTKEEELNNPPKREAMGHPMAGAYWSMLNLFILLGIAFEILIIFSRKENWRLMRRGVRLRIAMSVLEMVLAIWAVVIWLLAEDMHKPVQMVDNFTPVFIIIFAAVFAAEYVTERKIHPRGTSAL